MNQIHTPWDDARELTETDLRKQIASMAIQRACGERTRRELAFLDVLHQLHPQMCRCPARYTPHWLHERNEDPYGTPNLHPFWQDIRAERVGPWKIFERDGAWYGYQVLQNAWATWPDRAAAVEQAAGKGTDIWA